ncbi:hypothetical protein HDU98_009231 [Podochytrium sp. JEL0797]|nr:hypothetical protein HDU98_009231 [Podochytrium sp. JEL0797]
MEHPSLCVPDEFSRYQLLKKSAVHRWKTQNSGDQGSKSDESFKRTTAPNRKMSSFFGNIFATSPSTALVQQTPMRKDRYGETASIQSPTVPSSLRGSVTSFESSAFSNASYNPTPANGGTNILSRLVNLYGQEYLQRTDTLRDEDSLILHMFETGITYTYMPFSHLERVKQDRIVSDAAVLNSFWLQAELINRFTTPFQQAGGEGLPAGLGAFRFSVRFGDVWGWVMENVGALERGAGEKVVSVSEPIKCAGVDYRVLLSVEVDDRFKGVGDAKSGVARQKGVRPPSLFRMNRSKSLDDLKGDGDGGAAAGVGKLDALEADLLTRKFVLKATLQRNRVHGMMSGVASPNSGRQQQRQSVAPPIAYTIFAVDTSSFVNGVSLVQKPVTSCDFDGTGFVNCFAVPKGAEVGIGLSTGTAGSERAGGGASKAMKQFCDNFKIRASGSPNAGGRCESRVVVTGANGADGGRDLWLVVNIDLFSS